VLDEGGSLSVVLDGHDDLDVAAGGGLHVQDD
jgi:hypothetical protein